MIDAYRKIYKLEGISGLYRGFWISSIQIVSGVFYVSTYEGVRHILNQDTMTARIDSRIKALIGGGAASVVSQTIVVPFDVLSQHLMVLGVSFKHGKLAFDKVTY
jgi:solute carrier family 25 protein 44